MSKRIFTCFVLALCFLISSLSIAKAECPRNGNADIRTESWVCTYHPNGRLKGETPYKNGKREGISKFYYESGKLKEENPFKNGKREGLMKSYRENGKLFATILYKNDSPVSGKCHNRNGTTEPLTNAELTNWNNGLEITCN